LPGDRSPSAPAWPPAIPPANPASPGCEGPDAEDLAEYGAEYGACLKSLCESRLESLQRSLSLIVTARSLDEAIEGMLDEAVLFLGVPSLLLVVNRSDPDNGRQVYSRGVPDETARRLAVQLAAGGRGPDETLVAVEVASARRRHGWLVACRQGVSDAADVDPEMLGAVANVAAVALDAGSAVEHFRHEAASARALADLAHSMTEIGTLDSVAARLAEAIPKVLACDRAVVLIGEVGDPGGRVVGTHGFTPEQEARIQRLRRSTFHLGVRNEGDRRRFIHYRADQSAGPFRQDLDALGVKGVTVVPIRAAEGIVGQMVAMSTTRAKLPDRHPDIDAELDGLANLAITAIRNARLHDEVRHQAMHDDLTGLPNRALVLDRLEQMARQGARTSAEVAVLFVDLDHFKVVNDQFGHDIGDHLLRQVADRLDGSLRSGDTAGRMGGDEFVVVLGPSLEPIDAKGVAARLLATLQLPFELGAPDVRVLRTTASIGIAGGKGMIDPRELLRQADVALYVAKNAGRACSRTYDESMARPSEDLLSLEMDARRALGDGQLHLAYQPIVNLDSLVVEGFEALLRWAHPERGSVSPEEFIPVMEEAGLMEAVGAWVIERACHVAAGWHVAGHLATLSVNVSFRQLNPDIVGVVADALASSGFDPTYLILELTESTLMRDVDAASQLLAEIRDLGVRISIDDFGTGYSSLAYLHRLPVDCLKLDRTFVTAIGDPDDSPSLVRTIIALGTLLGLETVAEGIESQEQLDYLRHHGCERGQGYLFAHPLVPDELGPHLRRSPTAAEVLPGGLGRVMGDPVAR